MNVRILAASALALAILVPAANAATPSRARLSVVSNESSDKCRVGDLNLGTTQCDPFNAKVVHARVVRHVVKPSTAYAKMMENTNSHNGM